MFTRTMGALSRKRQALGGTQRGFTLIELLVVVLIIGILAAVAIPIFMGQQNGAKDSAVAAQITQAKTAVAVEIAGGATMAQAIAKLPTAAGGAETLDAYSSSADVTVTATMPTTSTFLIQGLWIKDDVAGATTATATNHGHTITDTGAAVKVKP